MYLLRRDYPFSVIDLRLRPEEEVAINSTLSPVTGDCMATQSNGSSIQAE